MVLDADALPSPDGDECRVLDVHGLRSRGMREGLFCVNRGQERTGWGNPGGGISAIAHSGRSEFVGYYCCSCRTEEGLRGVSRPVSSRVHSGGARQAFEHCSSTFRDDRDDRDGENGFTAQSLVLETCGDGGRFHLQLQQDATSTAQPPGEDGFIFLLTCRRSCYEHPRASKIA